MYIQKKDLLFVLNVYTINYMEISYDESKNQSNIKKHGLSFDEVKNLDWDSLMAIEDIRSLPQNRKSTAERLDLVLFSPDFR